MQFSSRLLALVGTALLATTPVQANYQLDTLYDNTTFFKDFDFFTETDPTKGFVEYVDSQTANTEGLAGYAKGGIYMGVDSTTKNPAKGRKSVRLTSQKSFTRGLFIADIAHMPGSICGTWPAFWMFGPSWPSSGEIDIIEGVNTQTKNSITLHTNQGCTVSNAGTVATTKFASSDCGASGTSAGCGQQTDDNQNYGDGFNAIGGGVYATEWTSDHISVWFFPRSKIPQDISSGAPNPQNWASPIARFVGGGSCSIDSHFSNNQLVFDTTFCGDWAGSPNVWNTNPECSALAPTCQEYVSNNPEHFAEAYWVVNSIKVYQQGAGGNQTQTALPSATQPPATQVLTLMPTATASVFVTTTSVVVTKTTVVEAVPAAASTPAVKQAWNGQVWNGQPQTDNGVVNKQVSQVQAPPNKDTSWSGQAWNGQGWGAKRRRDVN